MDSLQLEIHILELAPYHGYEPFSVTDTCDWLLPRDYTEELYFAFALSHQEFQIITAINVVK